MSSEVLNLNRKITVVLMLLFFLAAWGCCSAKEDEKKEPPKKPLPLLKDVPADRMIKPKEGLGNAKFESSLNEVEQVFGRGEIVPMESDFDGNSTLQLKYKKEGLLFQFLNGKLSIISISNPQYATKQGVRVGCSIGDMVREFGTGYKMKKSLIKAKDEGYDIYYNNISAHVKDRIVTKIRIRKKIKGKRR